MCDLARAIGESLTKDIMRDITGCAAIYKDPDYLQNFSPEGGYLFVTLLHTLAFCCYKI